MTDKYRIATHISLGLAALFWAGNFVVGRALREAIAPIDLNFWRWTLAFVIILPLCWKQLRVHRALLLRNWRLILALGLTGIAIFHTTVYQALVTTDALNALLLFTMTPLFIVLGAAIFFRETITPWQYFGMVLSLLGAVVLIAHGDPDMLLSLTFGTGDLWMLIAILSWAAYSLLLKHRPQGLPQLALLGATIFAAILLMVPFALWNWHASPPLILSPEILWALLYVALFASILAFLLWNNGVARIGAGKAGSYLYLMPVFGALLSIVFLGEAVYFYQFAGGSFVLAGITLVNRTSVNRSRISE